MSFCQDSFLLDISSILGILWFTLFYRLGNDAKTIITINKLNTQQQAIPLINMQQLKQLMLTRSRFISSFKQLRSHQVPASTEQIMHDLLAQKKKLLLNDAQQSKLSQTVITQKIDSPYKLMQLYEWSKIVMKDFAEDFLTDSDRQDIRDMVRNSHKPKPITNCKEDSKTKLQSNQQASPNPPLHNHHNPSKQSPPDFTHQFKPQRHLSANMQDKRKLTYKIVRLYHDFFRLQKSSTKAQEIMHVYKKKLCDETIIVPTIFCWLSDWVSKEFAGFVKQQIIEVGNMHKSTLKAKKQQQPFEKPAFKSLVQPRQSSTMKMSAFFEPPGSPPKKRQKRKIRQVQPDVFFSIDLDHGKSKQDLYQRIDKISMINKNTIEYEKEQEEVEDKSVSRKRMSLHRTEMFTIQGTADDKNASKNISNETKKLMTNPYDVSNLLSHKLQVMQELTKKQAFANDETESSPINRQILIGAFYQKYLSLYKGLDPVLADLDIQYIKQIKRNDRKAQIKKRLKEISRVITRNQPLIKNSIQQYHLAFFQRKRKLLKQFKTKKNRYHQHLIDKVQNQQINDPEITPSTRYSSLDFSPSINNQKKIITEKKIHSNRSLIKQTHDEANSSIIYERKNQERQKQVFSLKHPIKFEFNLPSLPQKQRNMHTRLKEQSKIVIIQSGRYKLLDTIETKDHAEMSNRKKKLNNYSLELGELGEKQQSVARNESYSSKKIAQFDRRSASIFEIITKKKMPIPEDILHISAKEALCESGPQQTVQSRRKYRNIKSIRESENAQKQFKQMLEKLQGNDYELISGWEKGEDTPQMN